MDESVENYADGKNDSGIELQADFSSLNLSDISPAKKLPKTPKRVLHFSDGTLEEYSSDEEEKETAPDSVSAVNPHTLPWGQWITHKAAQTGKSILATCDYVGGGIANFLGITSQKYFYEIEEYKRMMEQRAEEEKAVAEGMAGWSSKSTNLEHKEDGQELIQTQIEKHFEKDESRVNGVEDGKKKY